MPKEKKKIEEGKKVDGIVRLSREEIKKSRQIVLETIGEADKKEELPAPKKVDGVLKVSPERKKISLTKKFFGFKTKPELSKEPELKKEPKLKSDFKKKKTAAGLPVAIKKVGPEPIESKPFNEKKKRAWREEIKKLISKKKKKEKPEKKNASAALAVRPKPEPALKIPRKPALDIIKKEKIEKDKKPVKPTPTRVVPADDFISPRKNLTDKISMVNPFRNEVIRQKIIEQKMRLAAEAARKSKKRRIKEKEEKIKRKGKEQKKRVIEKKARLKARQAKVVEFKKKVKKNISFWLKRKLKPVCRQLWVIFSFSFILGIVFYSSVLIAVLRFGVDNFIFRKISTVVPLPAFITRDGIIEYYNYKDMVMSWSPTGRNLTSAEARVKLAERLVLVNLCRKYDLAAPVEKVDNPILVKKLEKKIVQDKEINQVGLNRIKKIKQLIDKEGQFIKIAAKYGDKVGQVTVSDSNASQFSYGAAVKDMRPGEISDIIFTREGYYIFRCYDHDFNGTALSYVFVRAKSLDEYLSKAIVGYRIISLAR